MSSSNLCSRLFSSLLFLSWIISRRALRSSSSRARILFSASSSSELSLLLSCWDCSYMASALLSFLCKSKRSSWRSSALSFVSSCLSSRSLSLCFNEAISSCNAFFSWWQYWCAMTISEAVLCVSNSSCWSLIFLSSLSLHNFSSSRYFSVLAWRSFLRSLTSSWVDSPSGLLDKLPSWKLRRSCLRISLFFLYVRNSSSVSETFFLKYSSSCSSIPFWASFVWLLSCNVQTRLCVDIISFRILSFSSSLIFNFLLFSSSSSSSISISWLILSFSLLISSWDLSFSTSSLLRVSTSSVRSDFSLWMSSKEAALSSASRLASETFLSKSFSCFLKLLTSSRSEKLVSLKSSIWESNSSFSLLLLLISLSKVEIFSLRTVSSFCCSDFSSCPNLLTSSASFIRRSAAFASSSQLFAFSSQLSQVDSNSLIFPWASRISTCKSSFLSSKSRTAFCVSSKSSFFAWRSYSNSVLFLCDSRISRSRSVSLSRIRLYEHSSSASFFSIFNTSLFDSFFWVSHNSYLASRETNFLSVSLASSCSLSFASLTCS